MKKIQVLGFSVLLAQALFAQPVEPARSDVPATPSVRLLNLVRNLPPVGQNVEMKALGISLKAQAEPAPKANQNSPSYVIYYPLDLDTKATDAMAARYPGVHLNLPLKVQPSYINYLFISDQPERILDERKRTPAAVLGSTNPGPGATGIYARSPLPAKATTRVLVDHTNGTKRPLRFDLVWIPDQDGFLTVRKRSLSVHKDSVAAGSRAFGDLGGQIVVEPRVMLKPGEAVKLLTQELQPEETLVLHQEFFSSIGGHLAAVVSEVDLQAPNNLLELDRLPVLHSIVWNEEEDRLGKFIDKSKDPTRWDRIKQSFQHARGHFPSPDRNAEVDYSVSSWKETDHPMRTYSKYESIPGVDVTVKQGDKAAVTDNRGKYGARVGLRWNIAALPPNCDEVALVAINRGAVYGGRHWVSDGKRTVAEVYHRPGTQPGLLKQMWASTLWRGKVKKGDQIQMWTEPMANTSVQLWYVLVPIPSEASKTP